MKIKPVNQTTFLEAAAAAIQHEKDFFDFFMRHYEHLQAGPIKDLFYDMAGGCDEQVIMIQNAYSRAQGGEGFPNLKYLGEVHKFQATAIQKLMLKLDRNKAHTAVGDELEALRLAIHECEDASEFFNRLKAKFEDPALKTMFRNIAVFNEERKSIFESYLVFCNPQSESRNPYWEDEELMEQANP